MTSVKELVGFVLGGFLTLVTMNSKSVLASNVPVSNLNDAFTV